MQANIFFHDILEFLLPFILKNPVYLFISPLISQAEHTVILNEKAVHVFGVSPHDCDQCPLPPIWPPSHENS